MAILNRWKIFSAVENQNTSVPLSDILTEGKLDFYDDIQSSGYFNFSLRGSKLNLIAGDYVGFIPLNARVALNIEPKVARSNWLHIVGKAGGRLEHLDFLRLYSITNDTSRSLFEFLSRAFIHQLEQLAHEGLLLQYINFSEITSYPRGKILFSQTIKNVLSRGNLNKVEVEIFSLSKDNPVNRLIRNALDISIGYLSRSENSNSDIFSRLLEYENLLSGISIDRNLEYLGEVQNFLDNERFPYFRAYYSEICKTALLLVNNSGISPNWSGEANTLTFIINMARIFEDYCFQVLRKIETLDCIRARVLSKKNGCKLLFLEDNPQKRIAEPDIVLETDNGIKFPLEVKYKSKPSRQDINQAITYGISYSSPKAVILDFRNEKIAQEALEP